MHDPFVVGADRGALVADGYRYLLWRTVAPEKPRRLAVVMLNPSTAGEVDDDPTLRRCIAFARSWGFGRLEVCNLFALRSPDPRVLKSARDPVGPDNDRILVASVRRADRVLVAWGARGALRGRAGEVGRLLSNLRLHCLGQTASGHPRHPLYVRADARAVRWAG